METLVFTFFSLAVPLIRYDLLALGMLATRRRC
jgi:hypothetical protein